MSPGVLLALRTQEDEECCTRQLHEANAITINWYVGKSVVSLHSTVHGMTELTNFFCFFFSSVFFSGLTTITNTREYLCQVSIRHDTKYLYPQVRIFIPTGATADTGPGSSGPEYLLRVPASETP